MMTSKLSQIKEKALAIKEAIKKKDKNHVQMPSSSINSAFNNPYTVYDIKPSCEILSAAEEARKLFLLCLKNKNKLNRRLWK